MIPCSASGLRSGKASAVFSPGSRTTSFIPPLPLLFIQSYPNVFLTIGNRWQTLGRLSYTWISPKAQGTHIAFPHVTEPHIRSLTQWVSGSEEWLTQTSVFSCLDDTVSTYHWNSSVLFSPPLSSSSLFSFPYPPPSPQTAGNQIQGLEHRFCPQTYCLNPWNSFRDPNNCILRCFDHTRKGLIGMWII